MTQQQTKTNWPKCCGQKIDYKKVNGEMIFSCLVCGKMGTGKDKDIGMENFYKSKPIYVRSESFQVATLPTEAKDLPMWAQQNLPDLIKSSAMFIDRPATQRMIEKNIKYLMKANLKKCWDTKEGRESIVDAFKESLWYGSIMPDMGCIVPYKYTAVFIPSKETFRSALTEKHNGKDAMLKWIRAEAIYGNDICDGPKSVNGEFMYSNKMAIGDRGEIKSIIVCYFDNDAGMISGECCSKKSLLDSAEKHSEAHKAYMRDLVRFEELKTEGKTKFLNGREYYIKEIEKKDGTKWPKKIFFDELTSLYDDNDPDQEKMLIKSAMKRVLRDRIKDLNMRYVKAEWKDSDNIEQDAKQMISNCLDNAASQVAPEPTHTTDNIKDAEFEVEPAVQESQNDGELFDPNSIPY